MVKLTDAIYLAEGPARGQPLHERTRLRGASRTAVEAFFCWADEALRGVSAKGQFAKAIRYAVTRRMALTRFCDDGRLEPDNNRAENCLRGIALGQIGCIGTTSRPPRLFGTGCCEMIVFPVGRPQSQQLTAAAGDLFSRCMSP